MNKKPLLTGLAAAIALSALYFGFLLLIGGLDHALGFIGALWIWLLLIVAGFGTQAGLYAYVRQKIKSRSAKVEAASTMGVSTGAMIACCLHLAAELLPIAGLSAATIFLTRYQMPFLLTGVFSNLLGVAFMINKIKKHGLFEENGLFSKLPDWKFRRTATVLIALAVAAISASALGAQELPNPTGLEKREIVSNKVLFEVTPDLSVPGVIAFDVGINNHMIGLNFQMDKISTLLINGSEPVDVYVWEGSSPGSHHMNGRLLFRIDPEKMARLKDLNLAFNLEETRFGKLDFAWEIKR